MTTRVERLFMRRTGRYLSDLRRAVRRDLLRELAAHFADCGDLGTYQAYVARFGTPAQYAAELRLAGGFRPRSPFRRRRVIVLVAVVSSAAIALFGLDWARHYQPVILGNGCFRADPPGQLVQVGPLEEVRLTYADSRPVRVVWTLTNTGSHPVDISAIVFPPGNFLLGDFSVRLGPSRSQGGCALDRDTTAVTSFVLHPHELRNLVLSGRFVGCEAYKSSDSAGIGGVAATLSVYGISHTTVLALQPSLLVQIPASYVCPRTLPPDVTAPPPSHVP